MRVNIVFWDNIILPEVLLNSRIMSGFPHIHLLFLEPLKIFKMEMSISVSQYPAPCNMLHIFLTYCEHLLIFSP